MLAAASLDNDEFLFELDGLQRPLEKDHGIDTSNSHTGNNPTSNLTQGFKRLQETRNERTFDQACAIPLVDDKTASSSQINSNWLSLHRPARRPENDLVNLNDESANHFDSANNLAFSLDPPSAFDIHQHQQQRMELIHHAPTHGIIIRNHSAATPEPNHRVTFSISTRGDTLPTLQSTNISSPVETKGFFAKWFGGSSASSKSAKEKDETTTKVRTSTKRVGQDASSIISSKMAFKFKAESTSAIFFCTFIKAFNTFHIEKNGVIPTQWPPSETEKSSDMRWLSLPRSKSSVSSSDTLIPSSPVYPPDKPPLSPAPIPCEINQPLTELDQRSDRRWLSLPRLKTHPSSTIETDGLPKKQSYKYVKSLGRGAQGIITVQFHIPTNKKVAIKSIAAVRGSSAVAAGTDGGAASHPTIIKLLDYWEGVSHVYEVLELCSGGDLETGLFGEGRVREVGSVRLMAPVVEAVRFLHELGILHREVSLWKKLMLIPVLADFGMAVMETRTGGLNGHFHTRPAYIAPEVLDGASFKKPADIFGLGVVLIQILLGRPIELTDQDPSRMSFNEPAWARLTPEGKRFVKKLLDPNPDTRFSACEALADPWFEKWGVDVEKLKVVSAP
ncbi:kinase-like domain-containing protein [Obelidium mucronatum]|nr:kinase-like domain-containing protein [Obelidium mucronatum]